MQVGSKPLVKTVMGPFSCQIEVHIPKGRQKPVRGIAFPAVSICKGETNPVRQGEALLRNKGSKKSTRMAPLHKKRLPSVNEDLCLNCLWVESPYHDPRFAFNRMPVCPQNAVRIRMLDPDKPFYIFRRNSCNQRFFCHFTGKKLRVEIWSPLKSSPYPRLRVASRCNFFIG